MSIYNSPYDSSLEPDQTSIRSFLDNLWSKFQPVEQARWTQANIDTLFYAGEQRFINSYFNFYPQYNWQNFHFNICQQPCNMVTGFQRQHRKSISYFPTEGGDSKTSDQYSKAITFANNYRGVLEKFSTGCEQATICGLVLAQPYLDFRDDPINGTMDLKIWSFNSFLVDPYFREPDMSDANFVWCQQFISKKEAESLFPDARVDLIRSMQGGTQRYGRFYFLPENYNMARNDLLVMSYVWYKWKRKRKKIYSKVTHELFDFSGNDEEIATLLQSLGPENVEIVEVEVPSWKLAIVLNEQLVWQGFNPLGFDECPFTPIYWNYDPHIAYYDLRSRGLVRSCRDAQYLFNRRIILNHDISESSINSGWIRRENAIANEENLRYAGQGKDIITKEEYRDLPLDDIAHKIIPNAVPPSDMQLADQMFNLIYETTGVKMENFGLGDAADKIQSGLALAIKQGAGLMVLQKYFDQWDTSLKLIGANELRIIQNNWQPSKIEKIIGEAPTPLFFNKMFVKTNVLVSEGENTVIQQQEQFKQWLEVNELLGGIIPKSMILANAKFLKGHDKIMKAVSEIEEKMAAMQEQQTILEQAKLDAELKELYSRSASNLAMARERNGRAESNIGLFEERLSEISQNHALATKAKVESLEKLLDLIAKYGEIEAAVKAHQLENFEYAQEEQEGREKMAAKSTSLANEITLQTGQ